VDVNAIYEELSTFKAALGAQETASNAALQSEISQMVGLIGRVQSEVSTVHSELGDLETYLRREIAAAGQSRDGLRELVESGRAATSTVAAQLDAVTGAEDNILVDIASRVSTLEAPIVRVGARPTPRECEQEAGKCLPEVFASGDESLLISHRDGDVKFESAGCAATDLCELARDVEGLKAKFTSVPGDPE